MTKPGKADQSGGLCYSVLALASSTPVTRSPPEGSKVQTLDEVIAGNS